MLALLAILAILGLTFFGILGTIRPSFAPPPPTPPPPLLELEAPERIRSGEFKVVRLVIGDPGREHSLEEPLARKITERSAEALEARLTPGGLIVQGGEPVKQTLPAVWIWGLGARKGVQGTQTLEISLFDVQDPELPTRLGSLTRSIIIEPDCDAGCGAVDFLKGFGATVASTVVALTIVAFISFFVVRWLEARTRGAGDPPVSR